MEGKCNADKVGYVGLEFTCDLARSLGMYGNSA